MSDLVITQLRPGMPVQRRVVRQNPTAVRASRSPFIEPDPWGMAQLRGLGFLGDTKTAASYAATGATVGSAIPVIGTTIGAAVGAAIGLFKGKPSRAEQTWDGYKPQAGRNPGTAYDEKGFAEIVKGAFDANRAVFDNSASGREGFLRDYAAALVAAVKAGKVPVTASVDQIYQGVGEPWILGRVKSAAEFKKNAYLTLLMKDLTTRYLANLPLTRADMAAFANDKSYTIHAPLVLTALKGWSPPGVASVKSTNPSAPPIPTGRPTIPSMTATQTRPTAPLGIPVTASGAPDLSALVQSMLRQGASQAQATSGALDALQSAGIAPTPQLQQAVAQEAATASAAGVGAGLPDWAKYVGIGLGGLMLMFALARPQKRGRA